MQRQVDRDTHDAALAFFGRMAADISHELRNRFATISEKDGLLTDLLELSRRGRPTEPERLVSLAEARLTAGQVVAPGRRVVQRQSLGGQAGEALEVSARVGLERLILEVLGADLGRLVRGRGGRLLECARGWIHRLRRRGAGQSQEGEQCRRSEAPHGTPTVLQHGLGGCRDSQTLTAGPRGDDTAVGVARR